MVNNQQSIESSKIYINKVLRQIDKKVISLLLLLSISFFSFSKNDNTAFNPFFRDSILNTKLDTTRWNTVVQQTDIYKTGKSSLIQKEKQATTNSAFIYIVLGILLILLILRLLFEDFTFSLLEGITSFKKFYIFYKSKKYDSLFAILSVYLLKIIVLTFITYIGLQYFLDAKFKVFNFNYFLNILVILGLFFTIKNIIEFIFNWVIDTQDTYRAFFLQNLFAEFIISIFLTLFLLILIYNDHVPLYFLTILLVFTFLGYVVFNIVRSYQLMGNMRIPYKLHFFLYICAFKILPLLVLVKYIMNNVIA